jgi:hypothetical protein
MAECDPFPPLEPEPPCTTCGSGGGHRPCCPVLVELTALRISSPDSIAFYRRHLPDYDPVAAFEGEAAAWAAGGFTSWADHFRAVAGVVRVMLDMAGTPDGVAGPETALAYLDRPDVRARADAPPRRRRRKGDDGRTGKLFGEVDGGEASRL